MRADIFVLSDKRLEANHKRLLKSVQKKIKDAVFDYDKVVALFQEECRRFPDTAMAWPIVLRRKGDVLEMQIKVVNVLSQPDGAKYQQSMQYYGRPPSFVAHRRLIDGDLQELVEQGLAVIRATKTISEVLTVLEQTKCSEESTSS
jgi:hypothetical protein